MRTKMVWVVGAVLSLLGCGSAQSDRQGASAQGGGTQPGAPGGGGSSGGASASSPPVDRVLSGLSAAENQQLCAYTKNFYSALGATLKDGACNRSGIDAARRDTVIATDAAARAKCESARDDCLALPSTSQVTCVDVPGATCVATVGEYEACLDASGAALANQLSAVPSCESLTLASLPSLGAGGAGPTTPACVTFEQKCPDTSAQ